MPRSFGRARRASPLAFFSLTFALALPFWAFGAMNGHQLMPGLPMAALMFVCPGLAAVILIGRAEGSGGIKALFARALDYKCIAPRVWYAPLLLLNPTVFVLSYAGMRLLGTPVPAPELEILPALALCAVFFVAALGEELGWSGYAIDALQQRWGELRAGLLLGAACTVFHWVALAEAHRSFRWIAWWSLWTVAQRVIMIWLYNSTRKSVIAMVLIHASSNVCWQLFPIRGSFFDPRITSVITAFLAIVALALPRPRGAIRPLGG
ncbi:MAG: type II CAAX prenyl endopeptidase Rce1 family protein [Steroidobacteraceae bacterium]